MEGFIIVERETASCPRILDRCIYNWNFLWTLICISSFKDRLPNETLDFQNLIYSLLKIVKTKKIDWEESNCYAIH